MTDAVEIPEAVGFRAGRDAGVVPRHEIDWTLGTDWFLAVGALHVLLGGAGALLVSPWWALAAVASLAWKCWHARPGERYLLIAFEDALEVRRGDAVLKPAGTCWVTARWLVIPTSRRVLPLRRGRLSAQDFARLRRTALAGGWSTSSGSTLG